MSNETFFRMLSIAFLGAVALAFIPDSQADSMASVNAAGVDVPAVSQAQVSALGHIVFDEGEPMDVEIESVQEVQDINAGRFNPAVAGDLASSNR